MKWEPEGSPLPFDLGDGLSTGIGSLTERKLWENSIIAHMIEMTAMDISFPWDLFEMDMNSGPNLL